MSDEINARAPAPFMQIPSGFAWGPMRVRRLCELHDGRLVISVMSTRSRSDIEITVSRGGRRMTVSQYRHKPRKAGR